jgi:hypothetical protein
MIKPGKKRSIPIGMLWVVLAISIAGSWSCGSSNAGTGTPGPTPTPTPTPTPPPTPTPTPPPLPAGTIGLKVLDTTVPPGGIFQFQLSNTEPKPIGHGSTRPQVPSGPVRGVAVNDPSGQAAGITVVNGSNIAIQLSSPGALLGTTIAYPIVTMSMPLSGSLTPGTTSTIGIDTANTLFADSTKDYTTIEFAPGTLTIAPSTNPYVSDVIPGGGLLADRTLIRVLGANFTPNTRVAIEDTTVFAPPSPDTIFISPNEIDVRICNGTVAPTATTCPNTGATFQLDGERVRVREGNATLDYYTYLRAEDVSGSSATTLVTFVHPMFSRQTYLAATIPLVNTASQFTGLALQNTSGTDDGIKVELLDSNNASLSPAATFSFILPAGKKIARDVIQDWFGGTVPAGAAKVRMTVTSGLAPVQALGMLGDKNAGTVLPVIPQ